MEDKINEFDNFWKRGIRALVKLLIFSSRGIISFLQIEEEEKDEHTCFSISG